MQIKRKILLSAMAALVATMGCDARVQDEAGGPDALVGAWLITEMTTTTPDSTWTNDNPQPGLYVFTDRHFSLMLIPSSEPRALFPDDPSAEERLAAYDNFVSDAGTYEFTDSVLTMHNIIAKVPNFMNGGAGGPYRYTLKGDSLLLTFSGGWARGGEITYHLVRLK